MKNQKRPWGYSWRSSSLFITVSTVIALFADSFIHGFVVPILPYILEKRNNVLPADTQQMTYLIFTTHGAAALAAGPLIDLLFDIIKSRKRMLVLGLGVGLVGTAALATSTNLINVFVGRGLQAIGSTIAQVVGDTTPGDTAGNGSIREVTWLMNVFISVGALSGPAAAGFLLEYFGYWDTWSTVLIVLSVDIVLTLLITEAELHDVDDEESNIVTMRSEQFHETSALLDGTPKKAHATTVETTDIDTEIMPILSLLRAIIGEPMAVIGLVSYMARSCLIASFNTTIPTHVRDVFGWGSFPAGMMFVALQAPDLILGPLCGWLRKKGIGHVLTRLGFFLLAPLLWLLGAEDGKGFPWSDSEHMTQLIYVVVVCCIGCVQNFLAGGDAELASIIDSLEPQAPGVSGSKRNRSRGQALSNGVFNVGQFVGPLFSGVLADNLGYNRMNSTLGGICVLASILAICFRKK